MKRLIRIFGATLLTALLALPTFAADLPKTYYVPPPPPPPGEPISLIKWNGFYIGINAGYGWGQSDWSSSVTTGSTSPGGGLFGGER